MVGDDRSSSRAKSSMALLVFNSAVKWRLLHLNLLLGEISWFIRKDEVLHPWKQPRLAPRRTGQ